MESSTTVEEGDENYILDSDNEWSTSGSESDEVVEAKIFFIDHQHVMLFGVECINKLT